MLPQDCCLSLAIRTSTQHTMYIYIYIYMYIYKYCKHICTQLQAFFKLNYMMKLRKFTSPPFFLLAAPHLYPPPPNPLLPFPCFLFFFQLFFTPHLSCSPTTPFSSYLLLHPSPDHSRFLCLYPLTSPPLYPSISLSCHLFLAILKLLLVLASSLSVHLSLCRPPRYNCMVSWPLFPPQLLQKTQLTILLVFFSSVSLSTCLKLYYSLPHLAFLITNTSSSIFES